MRLFAVLVAVCALSLPAIAQTPDCTAAPDVDGLLPCRDKPPSANRPAMAKRAAPVSASPVAKVDTGKPATGKPDSGKYIDAIGAEDARMDAQLKNICRGC
jgi:hypothetical protein